MPPASHPVALDVIACVIMCVMCILFLKLQHSNAKSYEADLIVAG